MNQMLDDLIELQKIFFQFYDIYKINTIKPVSEKEELVFDGLNLYFSKLNPSIELNNDEVYNYFSAILPILHKLSNQYKEKYINANNEYKKTSSELFHLGRKTGKKASIYNEPLRSLKDKRDRYEKITEAIKVLLSENNGLPEFILKYSYSEIDEVDYQNFFIYVNEVPCKRDGHKHERIYAGIPILSFDGERTKYIVKAVYCKTCAAYYFSNESYRKIKEKGFPLCQIISYNQFLIYSNTDMSSGLSEKSILNIMGYNVNKQSNLSEFDRHAILDRVISLNIMSKDEIISFLLWNIDKAGRKESMRDAVRKWSRDIDYLREPIKHDNIVNVRKLIKK